MNIAISNMFLLHFNKVCFQNIYEQSVITLWHNSQWLLLLPPFTLSMTRMIVDCYFLVFVVFSFLFNLRPPICKNACFLKLFLYLTFWHSFPPPSSPPCPFSPTPSVPIPQSTPLFQFRKGEDSPDYRQNYQVTVRLIISPFIKDG